jgi:hypothetical protein
MSWAKRLERVCEIDMEHCPNGGGGVLKIVAATLELPVVEKILTHLGLPARAPPRAQVCGSDGRGQVTRDNPQTAPEKDDFRRRRQHATALSRRQPPPKLDSGPSSAGFGVPRARKTGAFENTILSTRPR